MGVSPHVNAGLDNWIMSHTTAYAILFAVSLAAVERNPCVDTYSGSPPQCVAFILIIVTGVVDVQLMSVGDHHRVLAVGEIKSSREGVYQLLAALC